MWKRLDQKKDKTIGLPVLMETTYDEETLGRMPNVADVQNPNDFHVRALGRSPTYAGQPSTRIYAQPTLNSGYSQNMANSGPVYSATAESSSAWTDVTDISPPSSPIDDSPDQQGPRRFRSMRDVSPVDTGRGGTKEQMLPRSNLPVPRQRLGAPRNESPTTNTFRGGKVATAPVTWDEYSGEPISRNRGRTGQVSPDAVAITPSPTAQSQVKAHQPPETIRPPTDTTKTMTFKERAAILLAQAAPLETSTKPRQEWRGASGRVAIASPLEDQPRKVSVDSPHLRKNPGSDIPLSANEMSKKRTPPDAAAVKDDTVNDYQPDLDTHDDPIKPIVPLKIGRNSPPRSIVSPAAAHHPAYNYPSPNTPTYRQSEESQSTRHEPENQFPQPFSTPPSAKPAVDEKSTPLTDEQVPTSRFSWTTYNTSTTYQHSPPPSPPPPMPAVPLMVNRTRPLAGSGETRTVARKPITASVARSDRESTATPTPDSPRPNSVFSTATTGTCNTQKALPRPPTELATTDHIEVLEAQLEDIRLRRNNIGRLLRDLNNAAPANPLVTDFRRMRVVDRRKQEFEDVLAEIRQEEHDVGLKLHRAWRKREREDPNGSESALWVRRVTR